MLLCCVVLCCVAAIAAGVFIFRGFAVVGLGLIGGIGGCFRRKEVRRDTCVGIGKRGLKN